MKTMIKILTLSVLICQISYAQKQTNIKGSPIDGGFGAIHYHQTNINGQHNDWIGIGGGIIIEQFFFGLYGSSTIKESPLKESNISNIISIDHGGFWVGYIMKSKSKLNLFSTVRLGAGQAILYNPSSNSTLDSIEDNITHIQPEIGIELNLFEFLRFNVSMSYSIYHNLTEIPDYTNRDLSGFSPLVSLRIGKF